jgi:hypothetical protein
MITFFRHRTRLLHFTEAGDRPAGSGSQVKSTLWLSLLLAGIFLQSLSLRPMAVAGDAPRLKDIVSPAVNDSTGKAGRPPNLESVPAGITKALNFELDDNVEGEDISLRAVFTPKNRVGAQTSPWSVYSSVNGTRKAFEGRTLIDQISVGGHKRLNARLTLNGETSIGEGGLNSIAGGSYRLNDRISLYENTGFNAERTGGGYGNPAETLTPGVRLRLSPQVRIFSEERIQSADGSTALTHAFGVDLASGSPWTFGMSMSFGECIDPEAGVIGRRTGHFSLAYTRSRMHYNGQFELSAQDAEAAPSVGFNTGHSFDYHLGAGWRFLAGLNTSYSSAGEAPAFRDVQAAWEAGLARGPVDDQRFKLSAKYSIEPAGSDGTTAGLHAGFCFPIAEAIRLGVGYNLSNLSSDAAAQSADSRGWFLEISGKL